MGTKAKEFDKMQFIIQFRVSSGIEDNYHVQLYHLVSLLSFAVDYDVWLHVVTEEYPEGLYGNTVAKYTIFDILAPKAQLKYATDVIIEEAKHRGYYKLAEMMEAGRYV